ncbi:MAG: 50S ribosomal protein L23 [Terriglobia bacterium]
MKRHPYQVLRKAIITEKGLLLKERERTLVFQVSPQVNKGQIKDAVEEAFKVKVENVRTANFPGKMRRRGRNTGYRLDWKKAYVKLMPGEKMPEYGEGV